jgi:hypothetical protein
LTIVTSAPQTVDGARLLQIADVSMAIGFSPLAATKFPTGGHLFSPLAATNLPTDRD